MLKLAKLIRQARTTEGKEGKNFSGRIGALREQKPLLSGRPFRECRLAQNRSTSYLWGGRRLTTGKQRSLVLGGGGRKTSRMVFFYKQERLVYPL